MSQQSTAHQLRAEVLAHQAHLTPAGYPPKLRAQVGAYARAKRAEGLTWRAIAEEVGLSRTAVATWAKEAAPQGASRLVPVVLVEEPQEGTPLSLVSPHGFRLEGLSLQQAAQLLGLLR
jgi:hypothetical protein